MHIDMLPREAEVKARDIHKDESFLHALENISGC